jgi:hypothetical protein
VHTPVVLLAVVEGEVSCTPQTWLVEQLQARPAKGMVGSYQPVQAAGCVTYLSEPSLGLTQTTSDGSHTTCSQEVNTVQLAEQARPGVHRCKHSCCKDICPAQHIGSPALYAALAALHWVALHHR